MMSGDQTLPEVGGRSWNRRRKRRAPSNLEPLGELSGRLYVVIGVLALGGLLTINPVLTFFSTLLPSLFFRLLWRRGEPPALFFVAMFQWLQASVAIYYTDYYGVSLEQITSAEFVRATWLSLLGTLVFAAGGWLGLRGLKKSHAQDAVAEARRLSIPKLFNLYLSCFFIFSALRIVAFSIPALTQPLLAATNLKWVIVFLLLFSIVQQRRHFGLLTVVVLLEVALGVLGFFSKFKDIFFLLGVVLLCSRLALKPARIILVAMLVAVVAALCIVWSVIKSDYREFLNRGTGEQIVLVSVPERIDKLRELVGGLDSQSFQTGIEMLVLRVSYVNYFALTMMNVPDNIPYEHGKLWLGAIEHVFMPRFLFPNKAAIDDSARTAYYTGISVAGAEEGTSIGIGYMAESYVDFGPRLMFLPVALVGFFCGIAYRISVLRLRQKLLGMGLATIILTFGNFSLEQSNIKLIGGNVMSLIVLMCFATFLGRPFWNWVTHPEPRRNKIANP